MKELELVEAALGPPSRCREIYDVFSTLMPFSKYIKSNNPQGSLVPLSRLGGTWIYPRYWHFTDTAGLRVLATWRKRLRVPNTELFRNFQSFSVFIAFPQSFARNGADDIADRFV